MPFKFRKSLSILSLSYYVITLSLLSLSLWSLENNYPIYNRYLTFLNPSVIQSLSHLIANTKKYLQSDWLRGVHIGRICTVFNICTLSLKNNKKNQHSISVAEKQKCIH